MHQEKPSSEGGWLAVSAASRSDRGRVRSHNEDAVALCEPPDQTRLAQLGRLYLLADGAGGHAAGEVASRVAVDTIAATYYDQLGSDKTIEPVLRSQGEVSHLHGPLPDVDLPVREIQRAFFTAHPRIRELAHAKPEYTCMVTTCLAAVVKGAQLMIAHVGDSRAYLVRPAHTS
jgi:serine/threonine protein phosphatase PrpC